MAKRTAQRRLLGSEGRVTGRVEVVSAAYPCVGNPASAHRELECAVGNDIFVSATAPEVPYARGIFYP